MRDFPEEVLQTGRLANSGQKLVDGVFVVLLDYLVGELGVMTLHILANDIKFINLL